VTQFDSCRDIFQVSSLDRAGQVSRMDVLMNKVLESRLRKVSETRNCAFPRKAVWMETKNRGKTGVEANIGL